MRRLFTLDDGLTRSAARWGERNGRWRRVERGVWTEGPEEPTALDRARAAAMVTGGVASHHLAGVLHGLDSIGLDGTWLTLAPTGNGRRPHARRSSVPPERIVTVAGLRCTDGLQTMVDLAGSLDDLVWERALESALQKRLSSIEALRGRRNQRVLQLRPPAAPPTESLLETLFVQLARTVPGLAAPVRQRETAVVAGTGWLCGRLTWTEVVHVPRSTARRLGDLADQAKRRPVQPRSSSATR